jgi:hypothetical protein
MSDHFHHKNELTSPPEVASDLDAAEVLRAWIVRGGLTVSLSPLAFPDVATWGILLIDIARHVARAAEQEGQGGYAANLKKIRKLMEAELALPTDFGTTRKVSPN